LRVRVHAYWWRVSKRQSVFVLWRERECVCARVKEKDLSGRDTTREEKPLHFTCDCSDAVPRCCSIMQCVLVCCSVRVAVYRWRHFIVAVGANIHQSCLTFCVACYTCHKYEWIK